MVHNPEEEMEAARGNGLAAPSSAERNETDRTRERRREDVASVPVVVKRSDEARRHPDDTLEQAVRDGVEQLRRPLLSLALSSLAAGLILGFTAMSSALAVQWAGTPNGAGEAGLTLSARVAAAVVYPLGFIMCILSGTQLFTEHTATAVYPVLDKKGSLGQLLRLWVVVIVGNLAGAGISASLLTAAEPVVQAREGYAVVAHHLVAIDTGPLLISSLLAGWLMAQGAWLMLGTSRASGQIMSIYIVTFLIGIGGLHHSIAGAAEMFAAQLTSDRYSIGQAARFIALALLGNLIGGSMFVAVLNYAHIRGTQVSANDRKKESVE